MDKIDSQNPETSLPADFLEWKKGVEELKGLWKYLWRSRIDDKVRAEGIASEEFPRLFIEKGTIIVATRDYKPLSFHEILEKHMIPAVADQANPSPATGGISRFIKNVMGRKTTRREPPPKPKPSKQQQRKNGGKGWLHYTLERF